MINLSRKLLARTVGIVSHVDAGKTTLTESILFTAGVIGKKGSVNDGTATTDFLEIEKSRGITVNSVCMTFDWKNSKINLIDTPGHAEFQFEVKRSLAVLDAAIVVVDSTKGVEAQTYSYLQQCLDFNIPVIFFANKIDMPASNLEKCILSINSNLNSFGCLINTKNISKLINGRGASKNMYVPKDEQLFEEELKETILMNDESFQEGNLSDFTSISDLIKPFQEQVLCQKICPIIAGSAKENISVEYLLDSINYFVPRESSFSHSIESHSDSIALNFKSERGDDKKSNTVVNNYCKVLSGTFKPNQKVFIYSKNSKSKSIKPCTISKLYGCNGQQLKSLSESNEGQIVCIKSDKQFETGSYLLSKLPDFKVSTRINHLPKIHVPSPIFFCQAEPEFERHLSKLVQAIRELTEFDQSLTSNYDEESGIITVGGQGKVHIEVLGFTLMKSYGLKVLFTPPVKQSKLEIVKESDSAAKTFSFDESKCAIELKIVPKSTVNNGKILNYKEEFLTIKDNLQHEIVSMIKSFTRLKNIDNFGINLVNLSTEGSVKNSDVGIAIFNLIQFCFDTNQNQIVSYLEPEIKISVKCKDPNHAPLVEDEILLRKGRIESESADKPGNFDKLAMIQAYGPSSNFFNFSEFLNRTTHGFSVLNLERSGRTVSL